MDKDKLNRAAELMGNSTDIEQDPSCPFGNNPHLAYQYIISQAGKNRNEFLAAVTNMDLGPHRSALLEAMNADQGSTNSGVIDEL